METEKQQPLLTLLCPTLSIKCHNMQLALALNDSSKPMYNQCKENDRQFWGYKPGNFLQLAGAIGRESSESGCWLNEPVLGIPLKRKRNRGWVKWGHSISHSLLRTSKSNGLQVVQRITTRADIRPYLWLGLSLLLFLPGF